MTSIARRRPTVFGRDEELAAGDRYLDALRNGSASLLLEGEPGIGKTTVWSEICARGTARGQLVLMSRPVRSETELPFAGLTDLVGERATTLLPRLPRPQRRALEVALLLVEPDPSEAVGALAASAGFLSILSLLSTESPVIVAIDDLQYLDRPSLRILSFATRRLGMLRVGLLGTIRVPSPLDPAVPLLDLGVAADHVRLGPLTTASLYHVIDEQLGLSLPRPTLITIDGASGGNPIIALELARALGDGKRSPSSRGGLPIPQDLNRLVDRRVEALPPLTRRALLRCAALARPTADLVSVRDLAPALDDDFVAIEDDGRIRFAHPLFASAVYSSASAVGRADVHRWASRRVADPDERTLHAALASTRRDGRLALRLHEVAERTRRRGAPEVAAELEERAIARTPLDHRSAVVARQLRAAEHHERAGNVERATALANDVLSNSTDAKIRARAHWLAAEIAYGQSFRGAIHTLEEATQEPGADRAQVAQLELHLAFAWLASMNMADALRHARRAERVAPDGADPGLIAEILATRVYIEAIKDDRLDDDGLRRSLALEDRSRESPIQIRPSLYGGSLDMLFGRLDQARSSMLDLLAGIAESGEDHELPYLLNTIAFVELLRGDSAAARDRIDAAYRTAVVVGSETLRGHAIAVRAIHAAFHGDAEQTRADASQALAIFEKVGWGIGVWYALKAVAFLGLSQDDFKEVERVLGPATEGLGSAFGYSPTPLFIGDLIDARLAIGDLTGAGRLIAGFESAGRSVASPAARVIGARGRALLESARGQHDAALRSISAAEDELAALPIPSEHGRTLLAKGQILRRSRRKRMAREAIASAGAIFVSLEMPLWAAKADAEMARIGLRHGARLELTETERRVAELAASGLTNREIAAQVFLTPKTVEDVVSRVYNKLDIGSRAELGARMARQD